MMDKIRVLKNIAFIVFVPSVIVGSYYGYKFIKNKYFNKDGVAPVKEVDVETLKMREKYKDIKSFDDFFNGLVYQPSKSIYGYDLIQMKKVNNLENILTLDELKKIYEFAKMEKLTNSQMEEFLNIIHKVYP